MLPTGTRVGRPCWAGSCQCEAYFPGPDSPGMFRQPDCEFCGHRAGDHHSAGGSDGGSRESGVDSDVGARRGRRRGRDSPVYGDRGLSDDDDGSHHGRNRARGRGSDSGSGNRRGSSRSPRRGTRHDGRGRHDRGDGSRAHRDAPPETSERSRHGEHDHRRRRDHKDDESELRRGGDRRGRREDGDRHGHRRHGGRRSPAPAPRRSESSERESSRGGHDATVDLIPGPCSEPGCECDMYENEFGTGVAEEEDWCENCTHSRQNHLVPRTERAVAQARRAVARREQEARERREQRERRARERDPRDERDHRDDGGGRRDRPGRGPSRKSEAEEEFSALVAAADAGSGARRMAREGARRGEALDNMNDRAGRLEGQAEKFARLARERRRREEERNGAGRGDKAWYEFWK